MFSGSEERNCRVILLSTETGFVVVLHQFLDTSYSRILERSKL